MWCKELNGNNQKVNKQVMTMDSNASPKVNRPKLISQFQDNLEYICDELWNDFQGGYFDDYGIKPNRKYLYDFIADRIFDIKVLNGGGRVREGINICAELKYLGREYIQSEIDKAISREFSEYLNESVNDRNKKESITPRIVKQIANKIYKATSGVLDYNEFYNFCYNNFLLNDNQIDDVWYEYCKLTDDLDEMNENYATATLTDLSLLPGDSKNYSLNQKIKNIVYNLIDKLDYYWDTEDVIDCLNRKYKCNIDLSDEDTFERIELITNKYRDMFDYDD